MPNHYYKTSKKPYYKKEKKNKKNKVGKPVFKWIGVVLPKKKDFSKYVTEHNEVDAVTEKPAIPRKPISWNHKPIAVEPVHNTYG